MAFSAHIFIENFIVSPSILVLTCDVKMTPHTVQILGLIFSQEKWGNWTSILHGNFSCISELDVRLLNHQNWTSITQVKVHFLGLP